MGLLGGFKGKLIGKEKKTKEGKDQVVCVKFHTFSEFDDAVPSGSGFQPARNEVVKERKRPVKPEVTSVFGQTANGHANEAKSPTNAARTPATNTTKLSIEEIYGISPTKAAKSPAKATETAKSPAKTKDKTKAPARPAEAAKSPAKSKDAAKSPAKSKEAAKSPAKPKEAAKSPAKPKEAAKSPAKSKEAAKSPAKTKDKAPAKATDKAKAPAKPAEAAKSPANSKDAAKSPAKSKDAAKSPEPAKLAASNGTQSPSEAKSAFLKSTAAKTQAPKPPPAKTPTPAPVKKTKIDAPAAPIVTQTIQFPLQESDSDDGNFQIHFAQHSTAATNFGDMSDDDDGPDLSPITYSSQATSIFFGGDDEPAVLRPRNIRMDDDNYSDASSASA